MPASDDLEARRAKRQSWPISKHRLSDDASDDLSATTTPAERIAMMWPLALEAWRVAGRELPTYARKDIPCRLFRPGEPRPDDDA
jgi:hypothetical protein